MSKDASFVDQSLQMDIVPRRMELDLPPSRRLAKQLRTRHKRFSPTERLYPGWISYSTQRHVRDMAVDVVRGQVWLATWGGVLCWTPGTSTCTRHTSEHGLAGNANGYLVVDREGIVWVGGHSSGLCSLLPDTQTAWQSHSDVRSWTVLSMAPRPGKGVYIALRDTEGKCALAEIESPNAPLRLLAHGGLTCKDIEAMLVDNDTLWVGNAWGLHRYKGDGVFDSFEMAGNQVCALASGIGGVLWVGTQHGIHRFYPDRGQSLVQEVNWPTDPVVSMTVEPDTSILWLATAGEIGRIVDDGWQPVRNSPSGQLNKLLLPDANKDLTLPGAPLLPEGCVWACGANGLWEVGIDECELAFAPDNEDALSNAVQCLSVSEAALWMGAARGLYQFDVQKQAWRSYEADAPELRDVCAVLLGQTNGRLWVGARRGGLRRLELGVYVPEQSLRGPIVSLTAGVDGILWAATIDSIYKQPNGGTPWEPVPHPAREHIGKGIITTLCHQQAVGADGEIVSTLWVGTSAGLRRYRPGLGLWDWIPGELEQLAIQALTLDSANHLWIGTPAGLFSDYAWQCHRETDVHALAFSPPPEETLWLGTAAGLEQWPCPGKDKFIGEPTAHFTAANSGLASDMVTALAVRAAGNKREVWIGSPWGVSCSSYQV